MSAETPRLYLPFPEENAESWFGKFRDMLYNIDSRLFDNLEHLQLVMAELPDVSIVEYGPDDVRFEVAGNAVFISRTLNTPVTVYRRPFNIHPNHFIGAPIQSGAVGPQSVEWAEYEKMEKDASFVPLGYVTEDYTIIWFNGSILGKGQTKRLFDFTGAGGYVSGYGVYHIDAVNGSDTAGDGSPGNPWKTLVHACSAVPTPTSFEQWAFLKFVMAPGFYNGNATLPDRLHIDITGDSFVIQGDLEWPIQPKSWDDWGIPTDYVPVLRFSDPGVAGRVGDRDVFSVINGQIKTYNSNPGAGYDMPKSKELALNGVLCVGRIWNAQCGATVREDATGPLTVLCEGAAFDTKYGGVSPSYTPCFFGEAEPVSLTDWMPNKILVAGTLSNFNWAVYGCARMGGLYACNFYGPIDWNTDKDGNPYPQGHIDGSQAGFNDTRLRGGSSRFGYDGGVTDPLADVCKAMFFDSASWCATTNSENPGDIPTFDNFDPTYTPGGRGYIFLDCAYGTKVDPSSFTGNLGPTDDDVQQALQTLDAMTPSGSPVPSPYFYVDMVNGSDTTGLGTIQKPWATLAHAVATIPAPTNNTEYMTGITIVMAPGEYNHSTTHPGGITMPYRASVSVVGVDVTVIGDLHFYQTPSASWFNSGDPALYYIGSPAQPTFTLQGDIVAKNLTPDSGKNIGQRAFGMDNVLFYGSLKNEQAGATVSGQGTGLFFVTFRDSQWLGSGEYMFGEAEVASGDENNIVFLGVNGFYQGDFLGFITFRACETIWFYGSIDYSLDPVGAPYSGRIQGWDDRTFMNCSFRASPLKFGDDGTLSGSPNRIEIDANSFFDLVGNTYSFDNFPGGTIEDGYRLIDKAQGVGVKNGAFTNNLLPSGPHDNDTVQKCLETLDQMTGAAVPRIQMGMTGATLLDISAATPALPLALTWNLEEFKDASHFTHSTTVNADKVTIPATGNYKVSFGINWQNSDPGQPKDVGAAVRLDIGGGGSPTILERTRSYKAVVDAQNARATNELSPYEFQATAGDVIDAVVWLDGSPGTPGNTNVVIGTTWMRIEKV